MSYCPKCGAYLVTELDSLPTAVQAAIHVELRAISVGHLVADDHINTSLNDFYKNMSAAFTRVAIVAERNKK